MKKMFRVVLSCFFTACSASALAQEPPPFFNDIAKFKMLDSIKMPPANAILFIGSSSFTKWTDVQDYFPGNTIVNRGFGGSSLPDVIRYANDIIFPYQPRQIVIYCGDNDFASNDSITAGIVISRVKQLFSLIRSKLPGVEIAYISIKPSPSRVRLMSKEEVANNAIRKFLAAQKNTTFIDVYHLMLGADKRPMPSIFLSDSLHMNQKGYAIWQKAIQPYLLKP